jgi:ribosomal protein S27AE
LATEPGAQRAYQAACPNCGAAVEFRSAASAFAVCSFCRSTVVREGDALRKIGESAELFDDHSPLQLGAGGSHQGAAFTLVGRLQYRYAGGTWNEWHALFNNGKSGWLSEDNGRFVLTFDAPLEGAAPSADSLRVSAQEVVNGQPWVVASITQATLIAAQGELPFAPHMKGAFTVADLRSTRGEVASLDYSNALDVKWAVGRSVNLTDLAMTGLSDIAEKKIKARSIECPSCGTSLNVKLSTTQSIVCHQCHAVVDVSQGVGGDLQHYAQANGMEPQIALGRVGNLALGGYDNSAKDVSVKPIQWMVVGYVERCEVATSADDEQVFWREYLLYNRIEGFLFLVDAQDGWSWTRPVTGVPEGSGDSLKFEGATYRKLYTYEGKVTYVLGEFYWQLRRDETTLNTDYEGTGPYFDRRLNREQTSGSGTQEITWSGGRTLSADAVMKAFKLGDEQRLALQRDATPTASGSSLLFKVLLWVFIIIVVLMVFRCGQGNDCSSQLSTYGEASQEYQRCLASNRSGGYRTGGGSYGGYSSGGGHK